MMFNGKYNRFSGVVAALAFLAPLAVNVVAVCYKMTGVLNSKS